MVRANQHRYVVDRRGEIRDPGTLRRRQAIVAATIATIARHSLSDTTMERVAARAGVSPGTVTFHFARKDLLLLAALDMVVEAFEQARRRALEEAGDDPARALLNIVDAVFDRAVADPERIAVWYAFWGEARARNAYMERCGRFDEAYQADLEALCGRLSRDPRTVEAVAHGLAGLLENLWQDWLVEGRRFDRARALRLAHTYLAAVFPHAFTIDEDRHRSGPGV